MKQVMQKVINGPKNAAQEVRFAKPTVYQDRLWYRAVESIVSTLSWPLDELVSPWMERHDSDAELVVFGRKPVTNQRVEQNYSVRTKVHTA